jgi:hypothetical protein
MGLKKDIGPQMSLLSKKRGAYILYIRDNPNVDKYITPNIYWKSNLK